MGGFITLMVGLFFFYVYSKVVAKSTEFNSIMDIDKKVSGVKGYFTKVLYRYGHTGTGAIFPILGVIVSCVGVSVMMNSF